MTSYILYTYIKTETKQNINLPAKLHVSEQILSFWSGPLFRKGQNIFDEITSPEYIFIIHKAD